MRSTATSRLHDGPVTGMRRHGQRPPRLLGCLYSPRSKGAGTSDEDAAAGKEKKLTVPFRTQLRDARVVLETVLNAGPEGQTPEKDRRGDRSMRARVQEYLTYLDTSTDPMFKTKEHIRGNRAKPKMQYRQESVRIFTGLYARGFNGIFADERGLDKMTQTVEFIKCLDTQSTLILTSVFKRRAWYEKCCNRFTEAHVFPYWGESDDRAALRVWAFASKRPVVLITTYDVWSADKRYFSNSTFDCCWGLAIVDAVHLSISSVRREAVLGLRSRMTLLILSGPRAWSAMTCNDRWALLRFVLSTTFVEKRRVFRKLLGQNHVLGFQGTIDIESNPEIDLELRHTLSYFVVMRTRDDVTNELPSVPLITNVPCRLSTRQKTMLKGVKLKFCPLVSDLLKTWRRICSLENEREDDDDDDDRCESDLFRSPREHSIFEYPTTLDLTSLHVLRSVLEVVRSIDCHPDLIRPGDVRSPLFMGAWPMKSSLEHGAVEGAAIALCSSQTSLIAPYRVPRLVVEMVDHVFVTDYHLTPRQRFGSKLLNVFHPAVHARRSGQSTKGSSSTFALLRHLLSFFKRDVLIHPFRRAGFVDLSLLRVRDARFYDKQLSGGKIDCEPATKRRRISRHAMSKLTPLEIKSLLLCAGIREASIAIFIKEYDSTSTDDLDDIRRFRPPLMCRVSPIMSTFVSLLKSASMERVIAPTSSRLPNDDSFYFMNNPVVRFHQAHILCCPQRRSYVHFRRQPRYVYESGKLHALNGLLNTLLRKGKDCAIGIVIFVESVENLQIVERYFALRRRRYAIFNMNKDDRPRTVKVPMGVIVVIVSSECGHFHDTKIVGADTLILFDDPVDGTSTTALIDTLRHVRQHAETKLGVYRFESEDKMVRASGRVLCRMRSAGSPSISEIWDDLSYLVT